MFWIVVIGFLLMVFGAAAGLSPVFPLTSRQTRVGLFTNGTSPVPIAVTGTVAAASADVTALGSLAGVAIGAAVNIPGGTAGRTVVAMDDAAHTMTLSGTAGATGTVSLTFLNPGGPLLTQGANFRLFKSAYTPTVGTVLANLTAIEADFDGYAPKVLSMTLGYIDGTSVPYAQSQLLSFIKSAGVNTNSIYGWWIDDGTDVIAVGVYNIIVPMTNTGSELSGIFADGYPTGSGWTPLIPAAA